RGHSQAPSPRRPRVVQNNAAVDGRLRQARHRHSCEWQWPQRWNGLLEKGYVMISTQDAFRKFRSRLELNQKEQDDASRRQKEVRTVMDGAFDIDDDFLTGSYRRWTKTKPLKDVDIFCVLGSKHRSYG